MSRLNCFLAVNTLIIDFKRSNVSFDSFGDKNVHFDEHNCFKKYNQKKFFFCFMKMHLFFYIFYIKSKVEIF